MADETAESMMQKLQAMIKGARESDRGDDGDGSGGGRAEARIRQLAEEKRALLARVGEMEALVGSLKSSFDADLAKVRKNALDETTAIAQRHQEDLGLVEAGVRDPLGRRALRDAWEAQPKATRGDSPAGWWAGLIAARAEHAADAAKAAPSIPPTLVGYLPELPPPTKGAPKQAPSVGKPPPKVNGADPLAGLGSAATLEDALDILGRA